MTKILLSLVVFKDCFYFSSLECLYFVKGGTEKTSLTALINFAETFP